MKGPRESPTESSPAAVPDQSNAARPTLAITDVRPSRRRLRDGSSLVSVRIGVAPQPDAQAGEVEIRVFFFDVTRAGELRPTEAEVAYEWLTPFRDWSDPSPKLLEATCLRPRRGRADGERLRYGGFVVRVYSDAKLQDERGEPKQILAVLRANAAPIQMIANATPLVPRTMLASELEDDEDDNVDSPTPGVSGRSSENTVATAQVEPTSMPTPSTSASAVPYGKPAPGKPGFVYSPHDEKFIIDVRGVPPGTEITDPNTGKPLRVP